MSTRVAYAGTAVAGDVYTAANHAKMPGGWIGDVLKTSSQTGVTTEVDITGLSLTVTVGSNRRILIEFGGIINRSVADGASTVSLKEGTTTLQAFTCQPANTGFVSFMQSVTLTPSAGAHTYKLTLQTVSGTGSTDFTASAALPGYLRVIDIGPAS